MHNFQGKTNFEYTAQTDESADFAHFSEELTKISVILADSAEFLAFSRLYGTTSGQNNNIQLKLILTIFFFTGFFALCQYIPNTYWCS